MGNVGIDLREKVSFREINLFSVLKIFAKDFSSFFERPIRWVSQGFVSIEFF